MWRRVLGACVAAASPPANPCRGGWRGRLLHTLLYLGMLPVEILCYLSYADASGGEGGQQSSLGSEVPMICAWSQACFFESGWIQA